MRLCDEAWLRLEKVSGGYVRNCGALVAERKLERIKRFSFLVCLFIFFMAIVVVRAVSRRTTVKPLG